VSHELRTPISALRTFNELLVEGAADDPTTRLEFLEASRAQLERLDWLAQNLLELSKLDSGLVLLDLRPDDLRSSVEQAVDGAMTTARRRGVSLTLELSDRPIVIRHDPVRISQVVSNLVGNAVKFTSEGAVTIRMSSEGKGSTAVRFEVVDSGIGISYEAQDKIFDAFVQADTSTTRRFGGTGLGLAICKQLIELMGGIISVHSVPGKGSTFFFTVPFKRASNELVAPDGASVGMASAEPQFGSAAAEAVPQPAPAPRQTSASAGRLLLVEDNPINQKVALGFLKHLGFEADVANDGLEAVEAAISGNYGLILMDCQMPRMDGYEATARIRAHERGTKNTPIIALTAGAMQGDRERCLEAGMDDYVTKPIDVTRLASALQKWLTQQAPKEDEPDQPVYDRKVIEQLRSLPGSDGGTLFDEVGELFRSRAPRRVETVIGLLRARDYVPAAEEAHALKGMSASVGAVRLAGVANEIQHAARKGNLDTPTVDDLCDRLEAEYRTATDRFPVSA
jgi:CheY-like chemotaxis protein/HPt (histidine-containing phosphotransfer) domain-containing protein